MKCAFLFSKLLLIVSITALFVSCMTRKQKVERVSVIEQLLKGDRFTFIAQQANPLRADLIDPQLRNLNGNYQLKITKDSIKCYLPYFGVARQAPYGSNDNGISFVSTNFSYDKKALSNGAYEITIVPKNEEKARKLFLTISVGGYASLNVTSNNRDAISFTGTIEKNN